MDAVNVRHLESEILCQVFVAACHSSSEFLGLAARTPCLTSMQSCSIGLRSIGFHQKLEVEIKEKKEMNGRTI